MLFMLTLYLTIALIHRSIGWAFDRSAYSHPATWIVPVIIGVLLAVSFKLLDDLIHRVVNKLLPQLGQFVWAVAVKGVKFSQGLLIGLLDLIYRRFDFGLQDLPTSS